jgi:hypothetical protein
MFPMTLMYTPWMVPSQPIISYRSDGSSHARAWSSFFYGQAQPASGLGKRYSQRHYYVEGNAQAKLYRLTSSIRTETRTRPFQPFSELSPDMALSIGLRPAHISTTNEHGEDYTVITNHHFPFIQSPRQRIQAKLPQNRHHVRYFYMRSP